MANQSSRGLLFSPLIKDSYSLMGDVLSVNKDKEFVQRVLNPGGASGALANPEGSWSTHLMAAEIDDDGNAWAFPTIIQKQDGTMHRFKNAYEAMEYNKNNNNAIKFDDIKKAVHFVETYKTPALKNFDMGAYPGSFGNR